MISVGDSIYFYIEQLIGKVSHTSMKAGDNVLSPSVLLRKQWDSKPAMVNKKAWWLTAASNHMVRGIWHADFKPPILFCIYLDKVIDIICQP